MDSVHQLLEPGGENGGGVCVSDPFTGFIQLSWQIRVTFKRNCLQDSFEVRGLGRPHNVKIALPTMLAMGFDCCIICHEDLSGITLLLECWPHCPESKDRRSRMENLVGAHWLADHNALSSGMSCPIAADELSLCRAINMQAGVMTSEVGTPRLKPARSESGGWPEW